MTGDGANEIARRGPRHDRALRGGYCGAGGAIFASASGLLISIDRKIADHRAERAWRVDAGRPSTRWNRRLPHDDCDELRRRPRSAVETMAAALSEPRDAIEDIIEPYLISVRFICNAPPRGTSVDVATPSAISVWLSPAAAIRAQFGLFR